MKVLVLGAGVIGTTSAWFLSERGHEVTVLERQRAAAMETSFANGGQIAASHVEPWANPQAPWQILKWLGQADAPLLFKPRIDPMQWRWGVEFLLECMPSRTRRNMLRILTLSTYSGAVLRELRAATGLRYDDLQRGILQTYTEPEGFDAAVEALEERGPTLGRPFVDTLTGSRIPNLKELRPLGTTVRILFVFDPRRVAILLLGGDKEGRWQEFYAEAIPLAERLYEEHLDELRREGAI